MSAKASYVQARTHQRYGDVEEAMGAPLWEEVEGEGLWGEDEWGDYEATMGEDAEVRFRRRRAARPTARRNVRRSRTRPGARFGTRTRPRVRRRPPGRPPRRPNRRLRRRIYRPRRYPPLFRGASVDVSLAQPQAASEFIRWVQSTLNLVMNLNLPVDGIAGAATRSAIRDFQRREGLTEDGIVGPDTRKALLAARTAQSPGANGATNGPPPASAPEGAAPEGVAPEETAPEETAAATEQEQFLGPLSNWITGSSSTPVDRNSKAFVQWVQQGLNKIMGLKLAVDGISGPMTRSAVRDFQRRQGLASDGIVGPDTERALIAAGAGQPPRTSATPAAPPPTWQPSGSGITLRSTIINLANQEWQRWKQGRTKESDPSIRAVLEDYWRTGAGWLPNDPAWWTNYPWSAAFISWIMRKAGAGNNFRYSAAHATYIKAAKDNRLAGNQNPFKAYRISEVAPQPGDLVCKSRAGSGATYDNIREGMETHCDIVTAVRPGELTTIGGNVSDSVSRTAVPIDSRGHITKAGYFAVIKVD